MRSSPEKQPCATRTKMQTASLSAIEVHAEGARMHRIALVCDLFEEGWASMDLVGKMLHQGLNDLSRGLEVTRLCPPMRRRFSGSNGARSKHLFNADRVLNRFWDYPRWLRTQ